MLIAIFVGWRWGPKGAVAASDLRAKWIGVAWIWLLRTAVPVTISVILVDSVGSL